MRLASAAAASPLLVPPPPPLRLRVPPAVVANRRRANTPPAASATPPPRRCRLRQPRGAVCAAAAAAAAGDDASSSVAVTDASSPQPPTNGNGKSSSSGSGNGTGTSNGSSSSSGGGGGDEARRQQEQQEQQGQQGQEPQPMRLRVEVVRAIDSVPAAEWDALVLAQPEVNPFLKHAFLHALEASGSAVPSEGWGPSHVLLRDDATGALVGAAPAYLKSHSWGEYIFDSSWANFSHMAGVRYYPKLQCCVPFTPVTGPRLLVSPGPQAPLVRNALARALAAVADDLGASSLHVTFAEGEEWAALGAAGLQQRRGLQYHWLNRAAPHAPYGSFDEFLMDLKQSKRKAIRQERRSVAKQGLQVRRLRGGDVRPALWDRFYAFYEHTVDRRWGTAYLKREFFHRLGEALPDDVLLVVAEDAAAASAAALAPASSAASGGGGGGADAAVAAALNLAGSHALFGRNWGTLPGGREYKHLHFELCYYQAIEEAISRGLPRVEAGAQGEHKIQRGYLPAFTYSAHYLRDPTLAAAVARFLAREGQELDRAWEELTRGASPLKDEHTEAYLARSLSSLGSLSSGDELAL